MLSKNFKANKFYQVTRYIFKYGNETDEMSNSVTVWDTLEKAKAYIDRYAKGLKFASAEIEVNYLNKEISYEDFKSGNYEILSFQKIYDVTLDGIETIEEEKEPTKYLVKGMNGFQFETYDLSEAKKVLYNNCFRFENVNVEYGVIELAEDGSWKKVLIEGTSSKDYDRIAEFVFCEEEQKQEDTKPETEETAAEPTEKVVGFRVGLGGKIYKTADEAFKNNPKDAKQVFKVVDNGDGFTGEYVPIEKPAPHIKTMQEWEDSRKSFTSFCQVGDLVDEEIVDYFINVLPPVTWNGSLVQCGEPYNHGGNPKTGRWEAMYITFAKNDSGQLYYAGICFKNQREAIA